ncbi:MAG TPA: ATP synthase subunit I [Polyangia bacterium]|nr:ATP synthase subunit I [Polyangia bacterium]
MSGATVEGKLLASVERWNLALGAALVAVAALIRPTRTVVVGVAVGAALACLNFRVLRWLVERIAVAGAKGAFLALLFVKMALLLGAVWLILRLLPDAVVPFLAGFSVFLISTFIAAIRASLAQARTQGGAGHPTG